MTNATTRVYAPPGDVVRLTSDEPLVFELADRLWDPAPAHAPGDAIGMEISGGDRAAAPPPPQGADPSYSFEKTLRWEHEALEFRCEVPGVLGVRIDFSSARVDAHIASSLSLHLSRSSSRSSSLLSFLARTLLEAPAAVLLGRRGWQVLHAGAVVGPRGAAVVRGPSGAGKSTLVAAALRAGLGVLGDESLFVSRGDPEALSASVRDLALRPDAARLLGILGETEPAFTGREEKRRVDLFNGSVPRDRCARRCAAVLLGARDPGPARLVPLGGDAFLGAFRAGEIPQERSPGDPDAVAHAWASSGAWRLSGASDLHGAVELLKRLVT